MCTLRIASSIVAGTCVSLIGLTSPPALASPCVPAWSGQFPQGEFNLRVYATAWFDDGHGPALYVGGDFTTASGVAAKRLVKWTNGGWIEVGGGVSGGSVIQVNALAVYDDGTGPALYVAGRFTTAGSTPAANIAKWDGTNWSALSTGLDSYAQTLTVYDEDGAGPGRPGLFVGGNFVTAGSTTVNYLARWDGTAWTALSGGTNRVVYCLGVHNDGRGDRLYVGGAFSQANSVTVNYIASWDGANWAALGSGASMGTTGSVRALATYDGDGAGPNAPDLIVGGDFPSAGGVANTRCVAKWNGTAWSALGTQMPYGNALALASYDDDGAGPHLPILVMAGAFTTVGGVTVKNVARWDGSTWSAMGLLLDNTVLMLSVVDDGVSPPALYASGTFTTNFKYMAQWQGAEWVALGKGPGLHTQTLAVADLDDAGPQKPAMYIGGSFLSAGGVPANRVARWDGAAWSALGDGLDNTVYCLYPWNDGTGPALYAGGGFQNSGSQSLKYVAKWNGTAWSPLGSGLGAIVYAMAVFDEDGAGPNPPALFAAGGFSETPKYIARWDPASSTWSAVGSGINGMVLALKVFDDGTGPALYAAGSFRKSDGSAGDRLVKWNGSAWSEVGTPGAYGTTSTVRALEVFDDDGPGPHAPALYLSGDFTTAGATPAARIAKWDGSTFTALGSGLTNGNVQALQVFDDGNGAALYAGGEFTMSGTQGLNRIAKWDGVAWTPLGDGVTNVRGLGVFDDDDTGPLPPALYAAGSIVTAGGLSSGYIARWGCPAVPVTGDFTGDGYVDRADLEFFMTCFSGPEVDYDGPPNCDPADFDGDDDIDQEDFGTFQRYWTGS